MLSGLNFNTTNNVLPLNTRVPGATHLAPLTRSAATHVRPASISSFQSQLGIYLCILLTLFFYLNRLFYCLFNKYSMLTQYFFYIILGINYMLPENAHEQTNGSTNSTGSLSYTPFQQRNDVTSYSGTGFIRNPTS